MAPNSRFDLLEDKEEDDLNSEEEWETEEDSEMSISISDEEEELEESTETYHGEDSPEQSWCLHRFPAGRSGNIGRRGWRAK